MEMKKKNPTHNLLFWARKAACQRRALPTPNSRDPASPTKMQIRLDFQP